MESLSKILKEVPWPKKDGVLDREQSIKRVLHHPLIRKWHAHYPQLEEADMILHMNRLRQYVQERSQCHECPGLERCPNDMQGHYTQLSVEHFHGKDHIIDRKVPCNKWLAHQNQAAIQKRIKSFYVDDRALKQGYSIQEIVGKDMDRAKAVEKLMDYIVKTRQEGLQQEGLYLAGSFGTGKTFLMCYMLHELAKDGFSGVIVYVPDFMEDLKAMFQEPGQLKQTIELLKQTDLLVFDDIGAENLNAWARDHVLGTILNYRMNRKPTFYTSNYTLDALTKHMSFTNREGEDEFKGYRIMDRIKPFVEVIHVRGENQRGK